MLRVLRKISFGLRSQGLIYLVRAPRNEFAHPRLPVTRVLRRIVVRVRDQLPGKLRAAGVWSDGALLFVYDLSVSPITFDFMSYLAAAELTRRRRGLAHIDVVFVAGGHFGVRRELPDYEAAIDTTSRQWRVRNILIPALALLPSVRSYAWCTTREQAAQLSFAGGCDVFPPDYRINMPCQPVKSQLHAMARSGEPVWPMLRATDAAKRYIRSYLDRCAPGRRVVVISMRNYGFSRQRNSRVADWIAFADGLDSARYVVIFVPDTEAALQTGADTFGRHLVCTAASWNLELRMALYEAAWLNVGLMHGPLELCWLNQDVRYVTFLSSGTDPVNSADALTEHGHRIGADLDFATPFQRIVWEPDELRRIEAAFARMAASLPDRPA